MRTGRVPTSAPARSSARSIAVSSAMLLVPTPRYSPSSRRLPPSIATTPIPIGPGLPEHAPSVHSSTAEWSVATRFDLALGRRDAEGRVDEAGSGDDGPSSG